MSQNSQYPCDTLIDNPSTPLPRINTLKSCARFCTKLPANLAICISCKRSIVISSFYAISDSCIICECCYIQTADFSSLFTQKTHFYHDVICDNCYDNSDGVTEFTQYELSTNCLINFCSECVDKVSEWCYKYFRRYDRYNIFHHNGVLVNYRPHPSISLMNIPSELRNLITDELIHETTHVVWPQLEETSSSYLLGSFREWCVLMKTINIKVSRSVFREFSVKLLINLVSSKIACIMEYDNLVHVSIIPHDIPWVITCETPNILAQPIALHKYLYKIVYMAETNPYMLVYEPFYHIYLPDNTEDKLSIISLE